MEQSLRKSRYDPHALPCNKGRLRGFVVPNCRQGSALHHAGRGSRKAQAGGFTLLEMLISISILGIIVLIIAGTTRLGFRSVDSGERKIESNERLRTSLNLIESQIQSEIPLTYSDEDGSKKYYFKGSRDSLQFSTNSSLLSGQRGYILASYRVTPEQSGKQVLYAAENSIGLENKTEAMLLEGFDQIYFEYFYKDPTAEQGSWVTQYPDDTAMPEKIAVHMVRGTSELLMIIPMRTPGTLATTTSPVVQTGVAPFAGRPATSGSSGALQGSPQVPALRGK